MPTIWQRTRSEMVGTLRFCPPYDAIACVLVLAARSARGFANSLSSPSNQRAQGMPGARCTRGLVCKECAFRRTRAYRAAEAVRHPLRNGFTAYLVLSPVSGLFCHRRQRDTSRQLDASIAAPGPHDFAVRLRSFVYAPKARLNKSVHRISSQRTVTTADAPLRDETARFILLIYRNVKRNIFPSRA